MKYNQIKKVKDLSNLKKYSFLILTAIGFIIIYWLSVIAGIIVYIGNFFSECLCSTYDDLEK